MTDNQSTTIEQGTPDCPQCKEIAENKGGDRYIFNAKCIHCKVQDAEYALFDAENNLADLRKEQAKQLSKGNPNDKS